ncbi:MAG: FAD-binding oxidoreductase [Taibaiella sp.]|nr:FAD-binding oxidoreductase [Taibaiella sp.]
MQVDYLIIGQGVCGTLLSRQLIRAGKKVMVVDNGNTSAAGRVAGGIINPVTGKRLVRTWLIDELLPFALKEYTAIEQELNTSIVASTSILDFHYTQDANELFNVNSEKDQGYLQKSTDDDRWNPYFRFNYGIGIINPCLLVNINALLVSWRKLLIQKSKILEEPFSTNDCKILTDSIEYKGIVADKIIFCDGAAGADNPYFGMLPWSKDKGEALIAAIPGLPGNTIYKQGISIVPWQDELFWIGASHDWKYETPYPTPSFRQAVTDQLDYWLKLPYEIQDHIAAIRPANFDRKPFIGFHPVYTNIGIFNGMGGKGCSLAPYFAKQFCEYLTDGKQLTPEVDVKRYTKILSR